MIKKIHLEHFVYIIEAVKDLNFFWIASAKDNYKTNPIEIDCIYYMDIFPYFHKGIEINSMTYSGLTNKVVTSEHKHSTLINGINYAQTEKYTFSYDAEKRLTSRNYYLQNQLVNRIVLTYNSMGDQVIKKEYFEGGVSRQTVDFQYKLKVG